MAADAAMKLRLHQGVANRTERGVWRHTMHRQVADWVTMVEGYKRTAGRGRQLPSAVPSGAPLFRASAAVEALVASSHVVADPAIIGSDATEWQRVAAAAAAASHGTYALQRAVAQAAAAAAPPGEKYEDTTAVSIFRHLVAAGSPPGDLALLVPAVALCLAETSLVAESAAAAANALRQVLHVVAAAPTLFVAPDDVLQRAVAGVMLRLAFCHHLTQQLLLAVHGLRSLARFHARLRACAPLSMEALLAGTEAMAARASSAAGAAVAAAAPVVTPLQARLIRAARNVLRSHGLLTPDAIAAEARFTDLHLRVDAVVPHLALVLEVSGPHHAVPLPVAAAAAHAADSAWQRLDRRDPANQTLATTARAALLEGAGWRVASLPWTLAHATAADGGGRTFAACQAAVAAHLAPLLETLPRPL